MSYLVFARKWRPQTFDDVVGQEHVTRTLKLAIEKDRVAHAYVFSGTRGVGKTTTARILSRALNCEKGPTTTPCGTCATCQSIIQGSNFDVLEIDGASNNSVDDIRDLRENINYSSMGGKYRIYVIDEVHMLTKPAFNALLKTLEEPPKNVIFIFATTEPQKIPETILSRCQRYDFRRISPEQILQQLEKICTAEKITFDREGLMLIARKADGSMRDGLSLLDQVYSFCPNAIVEKDVRMVLGVVNTEIYSRAMDAIATKSLATLLGTVEEVLLAGYDLHEFVSGFCEYLRTLLFCRIPGLAGHVDADAARHAGRCTEGDILRMNEILHKAEYDLKWSSYPRFVVEVALCKLAYLDDSVTIESLLATLQGQTPATPLPTKPPAPVVEKKKDSHSIGSAAVKAPDLPPPAPASIEAPIAPPKPQIVSMKTEGVEAEAFIPVAEPKPVLDLAGQWHGFIDLLMQERPNLGTFLSMASIISSSPDAVDARFAALYQFQFGEITRKANRDFITKLLTRFAGRPIDLHITLEKKHADETGHPIDKPPITDRHSPSLDDDMQNEPIIKNVLDIFNGEIV
jgi:DNA polymerase-3 subunit gamma/tau